MNRRQLLAAAVAAPVAAKLPATRQRTMAELDAALDQAFAAIMNGPRLYCRTMGDISFTSVDMAVIVYTGRPPVFVDCSPRSHGDYFFTKGRR